MKNASQRGYSLIELMLVVTIIMIVSSISIHWYWKAKIAAENSSAVATLGTMRQNQTVYYAQNRRFAKMDELNSVHGNLGNVVTSGSGCSSTSPCLSRGAFRFELTSDPSNLPDSYTIFATRTRDLSPLYVYSLNQSGIISRVTPNPGGID